MALTQKMSRKKSSESIVQPRKAATKVCRWGPVRRRKSFKMDIKARIAGNRDQRSETRTSVPKLVYRKQTIIVATHNNRPASKLCKKISRGRSPVSARIRQEPLLSTTPQRPNGPKTKGFNDEAFGNSDWHSGAGGPHGHGANLRLGHRSGPQRSRFHDPPRRRLQHTWPHRRSQRYPG